MELSDRIAVSSAALARVRSIPNQEPIRCNSCGHWDFQECGCSCCGPDEPELECDFRHHTTLYSCIHGERQTKPCDHGCNNFGAIP